MNQFPYRRFNKRLFSGLSILTIFAVGYTPGGNNWSAMAADNPPPPAAKTSQVSSIEIPGTFKDLPAAKDAVTQKRSVEEFAPTTPRPYTGAQLTIDESKGVAISPSGEGEKGDLQDFHATAYCLKGRTASGENVRPGIVAADPKVLPLGTVVHIRAGRYTGTYTVMDTGGRIKGRILDVYVPTYQEAVAFGRRQIKIKVLGRTKRNADPARKNGVALDSRR
ncbi:MAG TPA: 3D domain-containing protein [Blastocatellia bacterium]|jgi:3D (Asp-Asp-Asp) domain-containing protein|nr:3D domain-containing protein [Blastocatellia bacterium]